MKILARIIFQLVMVASETNRSSCIHTPNTLHQYEMRNFQNHTSGFCLNLLKSFKTGTNQWTAPFKCQKNIISYSFQCFWKAWPHNSVCLNLQIISQPVCLSVMQRGTMSSVNYGNIPVGKLCKHAADMWGSFCKYENA